MKQESKILALLLSVCLILTLMPLTVFAQGAEQLGGGEIIAADDPTATPGDAETPDTSEQQDEAESDTTESDTLDNSGENDSDTSLGISGDVATPTTTSPASIVIAAFDKLSEETEWQNYDYGTVESLDDLTLPETLTATDTDGEALNVNGVTWESDPAFDPDTARAYWFSPVLPEGYGLADGAATPMITMIIKPEGGVSFAPMADGDQLITAGAITGITSPVAGAMPDTTADENVQYYVAVEWKNHSGPFGYGTAYIATITLTAKTGFIFPSSFSDLNFTVNDIAPYSKLTPNSTTVTLTVKFPATAAEEGGDAQVTPVPLVMTAPVTGVGMAYGTYGTVSANSDQFTIEFRGWYVDNQDANGHNNFYAGTVYSAYVRLTPTEGYTFEDLATTTYIQGFKPENATGVYDASYDTESGSISFDVTFPATGGGTVAVTTEAALITALKSTTPSNFTLDGDIILDEAFAIGANHTLGIPEAYTLTINGGGQIRTNGKELTVNGGKIIIENNGISNNGGTVHINGGEISVGAGQGFNQGIANATGGTLKISNGGKLTGESGGAIYLSFGSAVEGANGVFNDRGTAFTATGQVTVVSADTAPDADGLTMGLYVFDGAGAFVKSAIIVTAYPQDTTVTEGAITESLSVTAAASNGNPVRYEWWRAEWNDTGDYWENNIQISGATGSSFDIPPNLTAGKYGFSVIISADGCERVDTFGKTITTVTVNPPGGESGDTTVQISPGQFDGVKAPVVNEIPVTVIKETEQYTGTISWGRAGSGFGYTDPFAGKTNYLAHITLTAKANFTFEGLTADEINSFTVEGVEPEALNDGANTGAKLLLTYDFPNTEPDASLIKVTPVPITGIDSPVAGALPSGSADTFDEFSVTSLNWRENDGDGHGIDTPFAAETVYSARIFLAPNAGYAFTGLTEQEVAAGFTVNGKTPTDITIRDAAISFTITFDATGTLTAITPVAITGIESPVIGAMPDTEADDYEQFDVSVLWVDVTNNVNNFTDAFAANTRYDASITLTAKQGFTFAGLNEEQIASGFTLNGYTPTAIIITGGWKLAFYISFDKTGDGVPTVVSVKPSGTGAGINGNVVVTFSEAMNKNAGTVRLNDLEPLTNGAWTDDTVLTIPYSGLAYSTEYTVNLSGFTDADNNALSTAGIPRIFTTITDPSLTVITAGEIKGIIAPVAGALARPNNALPKITPTEEYTGTVAWNEYENGNIGTPLTVGETFAAGKQYVASVRLTQASGAYTFIGTDAAAYTVAGATFLSTGNRTKGTLEVWFLFPQIPSQGDTTPGAPTGLQITPGDGQLALSWDVPADNGGSAITGYKVSTDNGVNWTATGNTNTTYTATGLTNGTTYTVKVRAVNANGDGTASEGVEGTPQAAAPGALTGTATISDTTPTVGDTLTATLAGGNNTGTLSYVWKAGGAQVGTGATYQVKTADVGKTITVEITSSVETGTRTSTATSAVQAAATIPGALTGTATISDTTPTVGDTLTASLVSGNNTGTLSYVWKAGGAQVGTGADYQVKTADVGKTITVEITSSVETGTRTSTATSAVQAAATVPGAPTNLQVTPGNGQLALSWMAPTNDGGSAVTGYKVSTDDGANWTATGSATTYTVTGLTNGNAYSVKVRAVNANGDGAASESVTGTPRAVYTVTVSANPTAGGSVSGGGTFNEGTSQTVTATANSGYEFVNWRDNANNTVVSTNANYTFTLNGDVNLVANFKIDGGGAIVNPPAPVGDAPATELPQSDEAIKDAVLTEQDKQDIAGGSTITVSLDVEAPASPPADAATVTGALGTNTLGMYLDINMFKQKDGGEQQPVTQLNAPIQIMLNVPVNLQKAGRTFIIIRVHNGTAAVLSDTDSNPNTITFETDRFSTYAIAYKDAPATPNTPATPSRPSSGGGNDSGGSSGGGGGGSSRSGSVQSTPREQWLEPNPAQNQANAAQAQGGANVSTRHNGKYGVRAASWQRLKGYKYYHDTVDGKAVAVRVYIDQPGLLAKDAYLSGYVSGTAVSRTKSFFEKWFGNKIQTLHFDQSGAWERPVSVAAKLDLAGWDTKRLYFYAYDPKTNSYRRIANPAYWIDANGYLRFKTEYAGEIIISEGALEKK